MAGCLQRTDMPAPEGHSLVGGDSEGKPESQQRSYPAGAAGFNVTVTAVDLQYGRAPQGPELGICDDSPDGFRCCRNFSAERDSFMAKGYHFSCKLYLSIIVSSVTIYVL